MTRKRYDQRNKNLIMCQMKYKPTDPDPRPYLGQSFHTAITMATKGSPSQKEHFKKRLQVLMRLSASAKARGIDVESFLFKPLLCGCETTFGQTYKLGDLIQQAEKILNPPN